MKTFGPRAPGHGKIELRQARRLRVAQQAKIVVGPEVMFHCEVRDLSTGGAKIAVRQHVPLPERFDLFICAHDIRVHKVRLRWREGDFAGVSFGAEREDALPSLPAPRFVPAAVNYPALVRSKPMNVGQSQPAEMRVLPVRESALAIEAQPARASVLTGPYGRERRRFNIRRGAGR